MGENNHSSNIPVCPCHRAFPCTCTSLMTGRISPCPRSLPFCHSKASIPPYLLSSLILLFWNSTSHTRACEHTHTTVHLNILNLLLYLFVNLSQKNMIQGSTVCTNTFYVYSFLDALFLEDFPVPEDTIPYRLQLFSHSEKFAIQQQRRTVTSQSSANPIYYHSSVTKPPVVLLP